MFSPVVKSMDPRVITQTHSTPNRRSPSLRGSRDIPVPEKRCFGHAEGRSIFVPICI